MLLPGLPACFELCLTSEWCPGGHVCRNPAVHKNIPVTDSAASFLCWITRGEIFAKYFQIPVSSSFSLRNEVEENIWTDSWSSSLKQDVVCFELSRRIKAKESFVLSSSIFKGSGEGLMFLLYILGNPVEILLQVLEKWYQGHFEQHPHQQVRVLVKFFLM